MGPNCTITEDKLGYEVPELLSIKDCFLTFIFSVNSTTDPSSIWTCVVSLIWINTPFERFQVERIAELISESVAQL